MRVVDHEGPLAHLPRADLELGLGLGLGSGSGLGLGLGLGLPTSLVPTLSQG